MISTAIESVVGDPRRLLGEQARYLLSELIALFEAEGLLANDDTVIVAARSAWPEYQSLAAYVCQPERAFRDGLTHFGFYAEGVVQPVVARIRKHYGSVLLTREEAERYRADGHPVLADLIRVLIEQGYRTEGEPNGIILLSGPEDPETVTLNDRVVNDTVAASGRPWAWTLGQRYTSLERLRAAVRTSDL
ncbi:hypothetical protein ACFYMW_40500 [Streptomyces sp. NPDC006692]|uniref:hypothetical protein n=1 Tax=Streptomyces sp. NPDC006692 TaxID=3364758 RepID=UPI0036D1B092